jgi:hypothetical protein
MYRDFFDATHFRGKTPGFLLPVVNQLKGALLKPKSIAGET